VSWHGWGGGGLDLSAALRFPRGAEERVQRRLRATTTRTKADEVAAGPGSALGLTPAVPLAAAPAPPATTAESITALMEGRDYAIKETPTAARYPAAAGPFLMLGVEGIPPPLQVALPGNDVLTDLTAVYRCVAAVVDVMGWGRADWAIVSTCDKRRRDWKATAQRWRSNAATALLPARVERNRLYYRTDSYAKVRAPAATCSHAYPQPPPPPPQSAQGDPVIVFSELTKQEYHGTLHQLAASEVIIRLSDGTKARVLLHHLRHGRVSLEKPSHPVLAHMREREQREREYAAMEMRRGRGSAGAMLAALEAEDVDPPRRVGRPAAGGQRGRGFVGRRPAAAGDDGGGGDGSGGAARDGEGGMAGGEAPSQSGGGVGGGEDDAGGGGDTGHGNGGGGGGSGVGDDGGGMDMDMQSALMAAHMRGMPPGVGSMPGGGLAHVDGGVDVLSLNGESCAPRECCRWFLRCCHACHLRSPSLNLSVCAFPQI